jgi:hypothetical protein
VATNLAQPAKRFQYSEGDIPGFRTKTRRVRSSAPNPARRATSSTPPISLLSFPCVFGVTGYRACAIFFRSITSRCSARNSKVS